MKWCCPAFEGWYHNASKRGLGIVIDDSGYGGVKPMFLLQFRAVDSGVKLPPINTTDPQTLISTVVDVGIQYCPWCGRQLAKWYKKNWSHLVKRGLRISLGTSEE